LKNVNFSDLIENTYEEENGELIIQDKDSDDETFFDRGMSGSYEQFSMLKREEKKEIP
jgi:hypothetical protein